MILLYLVHYTYISLKLNYPRQVVQNQWEFVFITFNLIIMITFSALFGKSMIAASGEETAAAETTTLPFRE